MGQKTKSFIFSSIFIYLFIFCKESEENDQDGCDVNFNCRKEDIWNVIFVVYSDLRIFRLRSELWLNDEGH